MAYEPSNGGKADDTRATDSTGSWSLTSLQKYAVYLLDLILDKQSSDPSSSAKQDTGNTSLASIDTKTPALSGGNVPVVVSNFPATQPVSVAAIPLATDAATATNQATANTSLNNIDTDLGAPNTTVATDDTGTWPLLALVKRQLQQMATGLANWVTLQAKIPTLGTKNAADSMPVTLSVETVTGTISATNSNPSGAATANSAVEINVNNASLVTIQMTSSGGPPYFVEGTVNGLIWYTIQQLFSATVNGGVYQSTLYGNGIYMVPSSGFLKVRVSASVSYGGTPVDVTMKAIQGGSMPVYKVNTDVSGFSTESTLVTLNNKLPTAGVNPVVSSLAVALPKQELIQGVNAATGTTYTNLLNATGTTATDVGSYGSITFSVQSTATTGSYIVEGALDSGFTIGVRTLQIYEETTQNTNPIIAAITPTNSTRIFKVNTQGVLFLRVRLSTGITSGALRAYGAVSQFTYAPSQLNIQQATAASLNATVAGAVTVSATNLQSNINQIAGQTPITLQANGSTNRAIVSGIAGPIANTDYSAQAWNTTSGSGAVIADANGLGSSATFDVNLTAWTAGASTGLDIYLQESPDNGTTYYDIWQCEALTAIGRVRIPAIPIGGRRRMRWVNRTGAATTATVTVTAMELSTPSTKQVQWFDRTSGVGSGTAVLNTNSAAYDISSCKTVIVVMQQGTSTAPGTFQVQMSMDGTNWYVASAATVIGATTAGTTVIPLTTGMYGRYIRVTCTNAGTAQVINAIHIGGSN